VRAAVLAVWAFFFGALWLTGSGGHYLGPRTMWVIPFGSCTLTLLAAAYYLSRVRPRHERESLYLRDTVGLLALLVPIAFVLLMPDARLGAFAASRNVNGGYFQTVAPHPPGSPADISFLDIRVADGNPTFARAAGIRKGVRVRLLGFDTGSQRGPSGTFELARFYISCCVADAIPVGVPIDSMDAVGAGQVRKEAWLDVTGTLLWRGKRWIVVADRIAKANPPPNPYLSFGA
jgi:uncharacterized repeat protein (TIGR03943 family)